MYLPLIVKASYAEESNRIANLLSAKSPKTPINQAEPSFRPVSSTQKKKAKKNLRLASEDVYHSSSEDETNRPIKRPKINDKKSSDLSLKSLPSPATKLPHMMTKSRSSSLSSSPNSSESSIARTSGLSYRKSRSISPKNSASSKRKRISSSSSSSSSFSNYEPGPAPSVSILLERILRELGEMKSEQAELKSNIAKLLKKKEIDSNFPTEVVISLF